MRWASGLSENERAAAAVPEAAAAVTSELHGARPDLVIAFASPHHRASYARLPELIARELPGALLVGCSAGGVIGAGHEVEEEPALSLTAAALPGVALFPTHLEQDDLPPPDAPASAWREAVEAGGSPSFLVLADPMTVDAPALIAGLDAGWPRATKFGGLASGARAPGDNALFLAGRSLRSGAAVIALSGNLSVETIVAQGCRPIGTPLLVTRCKDNVILELGGRPPLLALHDLYESLDERDRELFRHSLFVGLEMREDQVEYREGELLVRNLVGADADTGALAVGAPVKPMQVVRFLLRDARTATEDLTRLLDRSGSREHPPAGALLFSCLGRGAHLFGRPDHDTDLFREKIGPVPLGGFFCNGEIGPVGGSTFLHGYTSAFALFRGAAS